MQVIIPMDVHEYLQLALAEFATPNFELLTQLEMKGFLEARSEYFGFDHYFEDDNGIQFFFRLRNFKIFLRVMILRSDKSVFSVKLSPAHYAYIRINNNDYPQTKAQWLGFFEGAYAVVDDGNALIKLKIEHRPSCSINEIVEVLPTLIRETRLEEFTEKSLENLVEFYVEQYLPSETELGLELDKWSLLTLAKYRFHLELNTKLENPV